MTSSVRVGWGHHAKRFCRAHDAIWGTCTVCGGDCSTCFGPHVEVPVVMILAHGAPPCVPLCEGCFRAADDAWLEAKCAELWLAGLEA